MYNDEINISSLPETTLGERVRKLRLSNCLTIKELSKLSYMAEETISNIEKSRTTPNVSSLTKLCQALNSDNRYLLGADDWPENNQSEIIYKYRMISGLSIIDIAKKCNLHKSTVKDYENGKLSNQETLEIIYRAIGYL